jgi:ribonuclease HI
MKNTLKAYVDGSYHDKSKTGGWGFIIYENDNVLYERYGQIPKKYSLKFEEYAFVQLLLFIVEKKFQNIDVYTDCLHMQKNWIEEQSWLKKFEFFDERIIFPQNLALYWISTKKNKADALSRKYLDYLFYQEKTVFENNWKNHQVYGKYKSPKIDYFYGNKLKHSNPSRLSLKEKKFITYHSQISHLLEIVELSKHKYLRVWRFIEKDYQLEKTIPLKEYYFIQMLEIAEKLLEENKNFIFSLTIKDGIFEKMASFIDFENQQEKEKYNAFIEKADNIILYDKLFLKEKRKQVKVEKNTFFALKKKILKLKERKLFEKNKKMTIGKMIAWHIREFQNDNQRKPTEIEKKMIIEKTTKEIQEDLMN